MGYPLDFFRGQKFNGGKLWPQQDEDIFNILIPLVQVIDLYSCKQNTNFSNITNHKKKDFCHTTTWLLGSTLCHPNWFKSPTLCHLPICHLTTMSHDFSFNPPLSTWLHIFHNASFWPCSMYPLFTLLSHWHLISLNLLLIATSSPTKLWCSNQGKAWT